MRPQFIELPRSILVVTCVVALSAACKEKSTASADDAGVAMAAASTAPVAPFASHAAAPKPSAEPATAPAASASAAAGHAVYYYAPEVVTLNGTLVEKLTGYATKPVPVVVFDAPIRIESKPGTKDGPPPIPDAREAWLSYNKIDKAAVAKLIGKKVTYKGTLEPSQTAHHLSDPWLDGTVTAR